MLLALMVITVSVLLLFAFDVIFERFEKIIRFSILIVVLTFTICGTIFLNDYIFTKDEERIAAYRKQYRPSRMTSHPNKWVYYTFSNNSVIMGRCLYRPPSRDRLMITTDGEYSSGATPYDYSSLKVKKGRVKRNEDIPMAVEEKQRRN